MNNDTFETVELESKDFSINKVRLTFDIAMPFFYEQKDLAKEMDSWFMASVNDFCKRRNISIANFRVEVIEK